MTVWVTYLFFTTMTPWCLKLLVTRLFVQQIVQANSNPDSKVHGAYMGPTWGHQDPGGSHVGHMLAPRTLLSGLSKYQHSALVTLYEKTPMVSGGTKGQ